MTLYLMRHGRAERARPGRRDAERRLTKKGREELHRQAEAFRRLGLTADHAFCSPLPRAAETAQLIAPSFGLDEAEEDQLLAPGCGWDDVEELLARDRTAQRVLLVGHQPYIGQLVYLLTGERVTVQEGTLFWVEAPRFRPRAGTLCALLAPAATQQLSQGGT